MMHPEATQNNYNISVSAVRCKSKFAVFNKHNEDLKKSVPKSSYVGVGCGNIWILPTPTQRHRL